MTRRAFPILVIAALALVVAAPFTTGDGKTAQIRLDTGDLRYCAWGVPYKYERAPEPYRSELLAVAQKSARVSSTWFSCATFPLQTSNQEHRAAQTQCHRVWMWSKVDPRIAQILLEDLVRCRTGAGGSVHSEFGHVLRYLHMEGEDQDWRNDEFVREYLAFHGYSPQTLASAPAREQ